MQAKVSEVGMRVLRLAATRPVGGISWRAAVGEGANAPVLASLVRAGLLRREEHSDGSKDCHLTGAGKAVLDAA